MTSYLQQIVAQWQHRPRRQQAGVALLLLLLLTGIGCRALLLPNWQQVKAMSAAWAVTRQAITQQQAQLAAQAPAEWLNQQIARLEASHAPPAAADTEMPFLLAGPLRHANSELLSWGPDMDRLPTSAVRWRLAVRTSYPGLKQFLEAIAGLPLPAIAQMGIAPGPHGLEVTLWLAMTPEAD